MRKSSGQVALALNLVLAIFVVGTLGIVSYEMSRILLAREQLKHCLELSALGGGAAMASTSATGAAAQTAASTAAINILQMNSILGQPLTNSVVVSTSLAAMAPAPGQVAAYCEFDDPITGQPAAVGAANVLRVYGAYAYPLFSGGFGAIGVSVYTVMADATAGLPALDLMIVYNHDDSMDDQTPVTGVRRYWDPTLPAISYFTPPTGTGENGPIWGIVCAPVIGTPVNGLPPQNLDAAGNPLTSGCPKQFSEVGPTGKTKPLRGTLNMGSGPGDAPAALGSGGVGIAGLQVGPGNVKNTFAFKPPSYRPKGVQPWLEDLEDTLAVKLNNFHLEQPAQAWFTAGPDFGSAAYNPWNADPTMFTDLVVNLDANNTFAGFTDGQAGPNLPPDGVGGWGAGGVPNIIPGGGATFAQYPFPTLDFVVEAARGNMETNNNAPTIHEDNGIAAACKTGYKLAYQCLAYRQLEPKITLEEAIQGFMGKMTQTSNVHFGFVAFNDRAGLNPGDTMSAPAVSWAYPVAGNVTYALPQIPLMPSAAVGSNNLAAITTLLTPPITNTQPLFVPNGGSNLADGLQQAMNNLTGPNSRTGSMKAILVVTDKVPTRDLAGNVYTNPAADGPALADAITVAQAARTQGIPIFMVTVAQNPAMAGFMTTQFSDTQTGGLVNTAGSGGTLYVENWLGARETYPKLVGDFNNVIRQLMTLVQG